MGTRFPVGGSRIAVYDFLREHGFVMSSHSDKNFLRADGLSLHLFGTGSMARINDKDGKLIIEDALEDAVLKVKWI